MRVSYLELRNYRRFREVKLQFPDGIVGIIGMNGSGKTTLIEGISWALFGNTDETVRTSRDSIRRTGATSSESCHAILEFELGGTEYRIEREMGGKSLSMKVSIRTGSTVLAEGDRDVRKAVEKLLGMDYKSFFTSVFARQKELNALQNVAAGERKKAVLRMLRIDGVDGVIQSVRADRRGVEEQIKGAESTLLDENGRDKEAVLKEKMPALVAALEEAEVALRAAEEIEAKAKSELDDARVRRDELKKDSDAFNTASKDLHARQSSLAELRKRSERIDRRMKEAIGQLSRMPELQSAEQAWSRAAESLDKLEDVRRKDERAKALKADITSDKSSADTLKEELEKVRKELASAADLSAQKEGLESSRAECEKSKRSIIDRLGELRAKTAEREEAGAKDRKKLEEIRALGKEGTCPTCERTLEEAYTLLVTKLSESSEQASKAAQEARAEGDRLQSELTALDRKEEALRKKERWIEQESGRLKKLEAQAEGVQRQLQALDSRIASKSKELAGLGEVEFSKAEYDHLRAERERLKPLRDEHARLKGVEEEVSRLRLEAKEVDERSAKHRLEEETLKRLVAELEPKKAQYESILKVVDDKMNIMSKTKDETRTRANKRDSTRSELQTGAKELEEISRVKKNIESESRRKDELGALEDVMVSFRDHLIGKVAPTLAELTSHVLAAMTADRYTRVDLDEGYEIQVEEDGVAYPLGRFSGGEADLANLALRLAISRIIAERTGANPINFLILDEIFGSLDPSRKRSVMIALSGLSVQFRQIFLITHIEDIKDLMNYVVKVVQTDDGTSTAALES